MKRFPSLVVVLVTVMLGSAPTPATGVCGDGVVDASEDCDEGGLCVGGANAGTPCTAETDCAGDGACLGGAHDLRGCRDDGDCPEGRCVHCRPYGGDGCAANCTFEANVATRIHNGIPNGPIIGPLPLEPQVCGAAIPAVPIRLEGRQTLSYGRRIDGIIPVAVRADSFSLGRIHLSTIACACIRGAAAMTCGGTTFDIDGRLSTDCTPSFGPQQPCPEDRACAHVFGPGNAASGFIECGGAPYDPFTEHDCNGIPGEPPFPPSVVITRGPPPRRPTDGAGLVTLATAIGTVVGACTGTQPAYGGDGQFCTDDDAFDNRGRPYIASMTTGTSTGTVLNPADFEGDVIGPCDTIGEPFTCGSQALALPIEATMVSAITSCDQPATSDIVLLNRFIMESALCMGDCDGDGETSVDELMRMVNIGLGTTPPSVCPAADRNSDGQSTVDEILEAVTNALDGCPD